MYEFDFMGLTPGKIDFYQDDILVKEEEEQEYAQVLGLHYPKMELLSVIKSSDIHPFPLFKQRSVFYCSKRALKYIKKEKIDIEEVLDIYGGIAEKNEEDKPEIWFGTFRVRTFYNQTKILDLNNWVLNK